MPTTLNHEWTPEKVESMHADYLAGRTLRELGAKYNLSHERIRQLFVELDLPTDRTKGQTVRRYAAKVDAWSRKEEIFKLYEEHGTIEAVVNHTDLPRQNVATVINEMPLRQIYRRKGSAASYENKDIIVALQAAAGQCGEPLTIPNYRKLAPKHKWPADLTVVRAFGTWQAACEAAGVRANPAKGPQRGAITSEDCILALRLCRADLGKVPSYDSYTRWAKSNRQPSGGTVRVKVGPWGEALRQAFDVEGLPQSP